MGVILAKFRKEQTTYEKLEKLEDDIKGIEEYSVSTQARQKRIVGNFLVISIGLYVIGFIVFYFVFFPPTWVERITYSVPMLIIPLIIFLIKRAVAWYFQRKLNKNSRKLTSLRAEKRKIIEKVMDKETYKVAIEILRRFGGVPKSELKSPGSVMPSITAVTPAKVQSPKQALTTYGGPSPLPQQKTTIPQLTVNPSLSPGISPLTPIRGTLFNNNNSISGNLLTPTPAVGTGGVVAQRNMNMQVQSIQQRKRTPYPIINQNAKGVLEKMVDYLIGDGPQNRFAMICKECYGHNGMALPEEYEYAAFRCAFCGAMNPSRKSRPIAPKLPMATPTRTGAGIEDNKRRRESSSSSTSTSEKDSGPDFDDEVKKRINSASSNPFDRPVENLEPSVEPAEVKKPLNSAISNPFDSSDENLESSTEPAVSSVETVIEDTEKEDRTESKSTEKTIDDKKND